MPADPTAFDFRPAEAAPRRRRPRGGVPALALVAGGLALALLATFVVVLLLTKGSGSAPPGPLPVVRADLTRFLADWKANPAGQVEKYSGKAVELRGYVASVSGAHGAAILRLAPEVTESPHLAPGVDVWFWPEYQGGLGRFPVGRKVTVRAVFERVESGPRGLAVAAAR